MDGARSESQERWLAGHMCLFNSYKVYVVYSEINQGSAIPHKTEQIDEVLLSILLLISCRGPTDAISYIM